MRKVMGLSYKQAGVDIDAGDALVERIRGYARRTHRAGVLEGVGGFAGLFALPEGMRDPVLVSGTDGVGTKLKVAFACGVHDTIGQDLVAMCVNDVVTTGADPLFFLDYFATGTLDVDVAESVIRGIAAACEEVGCALLGGETAELPGFYAPGEYDLAGFCVGVCERAALLGPARVKLGDALVGVASSGLHSNGFSLARKALERAGVSLADALDGLDAPLGSVLLEPTRLYANCVRALRSALGSDLHAIAHITGGGLIGNVPRALPPELGARIDLAVAPRPPIFDLLARLGPIDELEMRRTFNLGVGLVVVLEAEAISRALAALEASGERAFALGVVEQARGPSDEDRTTFAGRM